MSLRGSLEKRFRAKFVQLGPDECWIWCAAVSFHGYGTIGGGDKLNTQRKAHHVAWELANGPIPKGDGFHGICVCHSCDVRLCVNPAHLFLGTHQENMDDKVRKGRQFKPKLTDADAADIKTMLAAGTRQRDIAAAYCVDQSLVSRIKNGTYWRHVQCP